MDTPTNQIPTFNYDIGKVPDIGSGYAAGITEAGKGIAAGVSSALGTLYQNRTADDTLAAMNQSGMLSNEAYQAVAGKSLGAKQALLGMHAGEWINQQAQLRELQKTGYAGAVDVAKTQAILQAQFQQALQAIRSGYPGAAGIDPKKILAQPGATTQSPQPTLAQPGQQPTIAPTGQPGAGFAGSPTPIRYQGGIQPGPVIGPPVGPKDTLPPGSTLIQGTGPKGESQLFVKLPDGTHRPIPQ